MKIYKIEIRLTPKGFIEKIIEGEVEEKKKTYVGRLQYNNRIDKSAIMNIVNGRWNRQNEIYAETICFEDQKVEAITNLKTRISEIAKNMKYEVDILNSYLN